MRGRPVASEIRRNIIDILGYLKKGYGYQIFKLYLKIFPKCTREVIYYHLKKGITLDEFRILKVKQERGDYSWGPVVQKTYYELGAKAEPRINQRIAKALK